MSFVNHDHQISARTGSYQPHVASLCYLVKMVCWFIPTKPRNDLSCKKGLFPLFSSLNPSLITLIKLLYSNTNLSINFIPSLDDHKIKIKITAS